MGRIDPILYFISALLQLAAMVFCVRVSRDVNDRRPWLILFGALLVMFVARIILLALPETARLHVGPVLSIPISLLLFLALFSIRSVAAAERASNASATRSMAEREESENRYHALVELSPDVIFVNADGKIAYINAAALQFFGASRASDILGRSPLDFVTPETQEIAKTRVQQLFRDRVPLPLCVEYWTKLDGTVVPMEAAASLVPWQGGHAVQVILRDISDRQRAEKEKSELLARERAARSSAEHASRMKDEFLATLSHELRTPLNAILGWSQLLRQGKSDQQDLEEGLGVIERNARAQTQLIEDLLDMSRIISGKLRLNVQRLDPAVFIKAAIASVTPALEAKTIKLETNLDPLAGPISGDPGRLQQVIWNLLSNAIKFTPPEGSVQVVLARVDSHVEVTVTDTGQGIDPEFLPFVFDRFRQADASTTRSHGGLGLGLAIVKQLMDLHGGQVRVKSDGRGKGAAFTVLFPLSAVNVHTDSGERLHEGGTSIGRSNCVGPDLQDVKVLVVDDEQDSRDLVKRALLACNGEVFTAASAEAAFHLIREHHPDVIVSDIGMPEVDGFEFLRVLRAQGNKTPAIALTAFARSEDRTRSLMAGYQVHVAKPVESSELVTTVASLVGRAGPIAANK